MEAQGKSLGSALRSCIVEEREMPEMRRSSQRNRRTRQR